LDVGKRLALQAMKVAYADKKVVASGPTCKSVQRKDSKLILTFSNAGSGLISSDKKELKYFYIAGADKKFTVAKAEVSGNKIVLSSDSISNPVFVCYAWADNPQGANLYNREGLPASPFEAAINK
jgi:sialate O-acetylesterase